MLYVVKIYDMPIAMVIATSSDEAIITLIRASYGQQKMFLTLLKMVKEKSTHLKVETID